MVRYLTPEDSLWNSIMKSDKNTVDELRFHPFSYVVCLVGAKYTYLKNDRGRSLEDLFAFLYNDFFEPNVSDVVKELYFMSAGIILLECANNGDNLHIEIQSTKTIDDDLLYKTITEHKIIDMDVESVSFNYAGQHEEFGEKIKFKFDNNAVLEINTSSKRIIFVRLLKSV